MDVVKARRDRSRSARSRTGIADLGCAHRDPRTELSPTAQRTEDLVTDTLEDRQVMADAIHAGARYLITTDVDDFAFDDLAAHGMSAVNPDYFMASRFTEQAYMEGVDLLAAVQKNPARTAAEIHGCSVAGIPVWSHSSLASTTRHRFRPTRTSRARSSEA